MTEAERQMMNTIHLYGMILSLDGGTKKAALDRIEEIMREGPDGD